MENEQINKIKFVSEDSFYIEELKKGNIKAFEFVFNKYYKDLVYFCRVFLTIKKTAKIWYKISLCAYGKIVNISKLGVL